MNRVVDHAAGMHDPANAPLATSATPGTTNRPSVHVSANLSLRQ
jgi:hypothetical protein